MSKYPMNYILHVKLVMDYELLVLWYDLRDYELQESELKY